IRQFSPVITSGGGVVIENASPKKMKNAGEYAGFLDTLEKEFQAGRLHARVIASGVRGLAINEALARSGWLKQQIISAAADPEVTRVADVFISRAALDAVCREMLSALDAFHKQNALVAGMSKEELRGRFSEVAPAAFDYVFAEALRAGQIEVVGELVRLAGRGVLMKDDEAESKKIIEAAFASAGLKVPALKDVLGGLKVDRGRAQQIVTLLLRDRILIKISDELVFHQNALANLRQRMMAEKIKSPKLDVARFKDLTGVSRKYAIPLLEYLDREHVTRRVGDERVIL
ncbi:MAG TPA: SelB C-terminal domain-containing protein, partial [Candidatus Angelobacter sp.]|nr:SelB C-terminal domain-containing protein [Candidatus Angelobacter sp.]